MEQSQTMSLISYLPVVSVAIAVVSMTIALVSLWRTRRLQEFDYAARLQLADESLYGQGPGENDAFTYETNLENRGLKPVRIDSVYLDYGSKDSHDKRYRHHVEGEFYLGASEKRKVSFQLTKKDFHESLQKFEIDQCYFYLRVRFHTPSGTIVETTRPLVGLGQSSTTMFVHKGEILS